MTGNLKRRLDVLRSKAEILTGRYRKLLEAKQEADVEISELQRTVRQQQEEISRLRQQVEYLSVMSSIARDREEVERNRELLIGLVRDIDKCISELSE